MTTVAFPTFRLSDVPVALCQSWPVAIVEGVVFAFVVLGAGPAGVDPEVGFHR